MPSYRARTIARDWLSSPSPLSAAGCEALSVAIVARERKRYATETLAYDARHT
jgi:hypothetical protein